MIAAAAKVGELAPVIAVTAEVEHQACARRSEQQLSLPGPAHRLVPYFGPYVSVAP
jgi:hypothetical protein